MLQTSITQHIQHYKQPKTMGDIDLIAEVRQRLMASGLGQRIVHFDEHRFIKEAAGKDSVIQQYLLNRYWTNQLLHANAVSIEERYCLIPDGLVEDWLNLFESRVLPFIIANDLPCAA